MRDDPTEADILIDISGLSLRDLALIDDSSLALGLRRLLDPSRGDTEPIAGFNQSVDRVPDPGAND
ncbi:FxSxx-COOH cyclophane-containing RiPP peptide [Streptosporangium sp. KLBMP 9127]|nr:FxSxx-COOH protein [Streptosporangium sp. KLBMP 9127]